MVWLICHIVHHIGPSVARLRCSCVSCRQRQYDLGVLSLASHLLTEMQTHMLKTTYCRFNQVFRHKRLYSTVCPHLSMMPCYDRNKDHAWNENFPLRDVYWALPYKTSTFSPPQCTSGVRAWGNEENGCWGLSKYGPQHIHHPNFTHSGPFLILRWTIPSLWGL